MTMIDHTAIAGRNKFFNGYARLKLFEIIIVYSKVQIIIPGYKPARPHRTKQRAR